jgi:hypothetical protein
MFMFKFCTHCGGCMSTGLGLILSQESAYLGRESLHRIHWVLVHTTSNDAFMRYPDCWCPSVFIQQLALYFRFFRLIFSSLGQDRNYWSPRTKLCNSWIWRSVLKWIYVAIRTRISAPLPVLLFHCPDMLGVVMQNILNSLGRNMNLTLWKTGFQNKICCGIYLLLLDL